MRIDSVLGKGIIPPISSLVCYHIQDTHWRYEPMTDKPMVYALSTCPYCKRAKRFLDQHKIAYDHIDVDLLDDAKQDEVLEKVEKLTGRRSFPVVVIGSEVIVGFDEDKMKKAFKL